VVAGLFGRIKHRETTAALGGDSGAVDRLRDCRQLFRLPFIFYTEENIVHIKINITTYSIIFYLEIL
jgi:hypothetical protein